MSIHSVLRHRAKVKRGQKNNLTGEIEWSTVAEGLPCLLSVDGLQRERSESQTQRPFDRTGILFAGPTADLLPGDRLIFTRGVSGTYLVKPDAATVATLSGTSHREFAVEQT